MNSENTYEKSRIRDRLKDLVTLFVFIIASLIASLIVMDLIIFPIALFSTKNKEAYNYLIINITWIVIICTFAFMLIRRFYVSLKNGMTIREISTGLLLKPLKGLLAFLILLLFLFILIYLIYKLMNTNHYLLYKIINI